VPEYEVDFVEDRLERIKNIKKKYGQTYKELIEYLDTTKTEIDRLENFNDLAVKLNTQLQDTDNKLYEAYLELSKQRKFFSDKFSNNVLVELKELGMPKANFNVDFGDKLSFENCDFNSANGIDNIEFLFSANSGEPLKPLSFVISGGEMSRFMLSIKAQTAKHNEISTFIFDEIDSGISGVTAKVVAEKFAKIAKNVQIIAISHLPQISAMADNNLLIIKSENADSTTTEVKTLSGQDKVLEIIRLIGGSADSESAILHARELISQADTYKNNI
ncbi:MAG: DNA repair protein RecN, partial [Clostridia bacterium]|nr:DNA repair protein RecN [Clostridia bacterium]